MSTFADPSTFPSVFDAPAETTDTITTADVVIEEVQPEAAPVASFGDFGLPRDLVRALAREGITTPFDIQSATIPDAVAGRDVLGRGQTGSGKTLAFGLPLLARVAKGGKAAPHRPKALILVPTRELAMQVNDALLPLGKSIGVFLKTAVGGVPYDRQLDALRRGVEVMVATPGRLKDLIERGACSLDEIEVTVLDEADQMADMGFLPEVTELLEKTPEGSQRLLFSATLDGDVDALVKRFMTDPVTHSTAPAEASVTTMEHHILLIPPQDKFRVTAAIASRSGKTMVFARTQLGVDRLVGQLREVGVRAGALHGGKTQAVRTRTLAQFKEGRTNVLVATDVAARGIHVDGVSLVVHVDPPKDPKDYLHRAGRTARAGESGAVATLVLPKQRRTTISMMEKAGVAPSELRCKAGDESLAAVTGAREPSGVPVKEEPEPERRSRGRFQDRDRGGYAPRSGGERRFDDRPRSDRPRSDRPQGDRAWSDRPRSGERTYGDRPSFGDRDAARQPRTDRPGFGGGDRPGYASGDRAGFGGGERRFADRRPADRVRTERTDRPVAGGRFDGPRATARPEGGRFEQDRRRPARTH